MEVSVNGIEMYYDVRGEGEPLVLLHGFTGAGSNWMPFAGGLAGSYRLVVPDLRGLGPVPGIAGRSPSYMIRQLYDFKSGARAGKDSALMKPSVEKLTVEDMIALAAYAATLAP